MVTLAINSRLKNPIHFGLDLRTIGLRLDQEEPLCRSFVSPWFDGISDIVKGTAAPIGCLDSVLPACYNTQPSPPVTSKIPGFADETLFYMFYAMPGDRMQDLAARELYARNWRFHKELKIWILMLEESKMAALQNQMISPDLSTITSNLSKKTPIGPAAVLPSESSRSYTVFDAQTWTKVSKELPVRADQLEDRFSPGKSNIPTVPAATPVLLNVNRTINS